MLRELYRRLVLLHPAPFRQRFGEEMLWIFDEAGPSCAAALLLDAIVSLARQWVSRRSWKLAAAISGASTQVIIGGLIWLAIRKQGHSEQAVPAQLEALIRLILAATFALVLMVGAASLWWMSFVRRRNTAKG